MKLKKRRKSGVQSTTKQMRTNKNLQIIASFTNNTVGASKNGNKVRTPASVTKQMATNHNMNSR